MAICSLLDYRRLTKDVDSYDGDILKSLESAQRIVERKTDRFFEQKERIETLLCHEDGRVYPHAYPLVSVSVPIESKIDGISIMAGSGIFNDVLVNWYPYWDGNTQLRKLLVTYVGGYLPEDMPEEIIGVTAEIARLSVTAQPLIGVPAGVSSIHVGDIGYSATGRSGKGGSELGGTVTLSSAVEAILKEWTRREL